MRFRWAYAALTVVAALTVTGGLALPLAEGSAKVEIACTRTGIHYKGTTRQRQKVCFTRTRKGKSLVEIEFGGNFRCAGGSELGTVLVGPGDSWSIDVGGEFLVGASGSSSPIATVAANGSFDYGIRSSQMLIEFKGRIARTGLAKGTLRARFAPTGASACNTGVVRWTARRARR